MSQAASSPQRLAFTRRASGRHALAALFLLGLTALSSASCVLDWDPSHRTSGSSSASSSSGTPIEKSCEAGSSCTLECPEGGCLLRCGNSATCDLSCTGGSCVFHCENTGECTAHCPGGKCAMHCDNTPSCDESCGPGNCTQSCGFASVTCDCSGCG